MPFRSDYNILSLLALLHAWSCYVSQRTATVGKVDWRLFVLNESSKDSASALVQNQEWKAGVLAFCFRIVPVGIFPLPPRPTRRSFLQHKP